jgi:uroporphyrinogen decarboxylase
MNSRERVLTAINFQEPDRVPFNFWMDRRRMVELENKYGKDFRVTHFGADVIEVFPSISYPHAETVYISGTLWVEKPLFEDWSGAANISFPDPNDASIYKPIKQYLNEFPDVAIVVDLPNVLTILGGMRTYDTFYLDLLEHPEELQALFHKLSDVMEGVAENVCKMDITALYVMDDIACNKGLLISPKHWREFILPHWQKPIDVAHSYNKPVFFHSDGNVQEIWDEFAQLDIRMLNPLQPDLQDVGEFKKCYHKKMGIYGGLATDKIHLMTPEEIRIHVRELFEKAGYGGGLIMSTHDIDYSITHEQLTTVIRVIKECTY